MLAIMERLVTEGLIPLSITLFPAGSLIASLNRSIVSQKTRRMITSRKHVFVRDKRLPTGLHDDDKT